MTHDFENALRDRAKQLLTTKPPLVLLLHHNDTDGLSAGAIISRSLERAMIPITRYCLEKPYPIVLEQLFADPHLPQETVVLFVDFGSGMLSRIAAANRRRFSVLVLDHHQLEDFSDPAIEVLNCNQHGISGSTGCSASAVAYCFALGLGEWNAKLAHLGVLGALGDSF